MDKVYFLFGVHNHQPVGNFDFVFEEAYQRAYWPFLEMVADRPWFRFTLHNSGCLWEWLEEHHPEYLDLVKLLCDRGQVELWGGGFYEPILPAIPERDRQGQLAMMSEYLWEKFTVRPQGAWVAERVWEPSLPSTLSHAGIGVVALDDAHFKAAGLSEDKLRGYYLTEDQGYTIKVFPISQRLRYLIPFHDVDEVMGHLLQDYRPGELAVLADDGEKFGVWPGTHDHVYINGWLARFLKALEAHQEKMEMLTFAQAAEKLAPRGRLYLPTASYTEMGEWVLEPEAEAIYRELVDRLKQEGSYERYAPFIRGGIWKNFFAKYPEANFIYRRMLQVSAMIQEADTPARRELYRGQCNCGYWHGIFGGLYLPHLRATLYRHLLRAEKLSGRPRPSRASLVQQDFDGDGQQELLISDGAADLYFKPRWGGAIYEWDLLEPEVNILDNLSRRPESYHRRIKEHRSGGKSGRSIHEMMLAKEQGLEDLIAYDPCPRMALVDHVLRPDVGLKDMISAMAEAYQGILNITWEHSQKTTGQEVMLTFKGAYQTLKIAKTLRYHSPNALILNYLWKNRGPESIAFRPGIECNFGLLSAGGGRHCTSPQPLSTERLDRAAEDVGLRQLTIYDDYRRMAISFFLSHPWDLWRYPVETVSQSEAGLERNYQCSCVIWTRTMELGVGESASLEMRLEVVA